jgi:acyl carrier protein
MSTVSVMDKKRIRDEVIEIMCNKLHNLPHPGDDDEFDYDKQALVPDITKDPLDIAEVAMDLEDAFGVNFEEALPGEVGLETIGRVVDYLERRINDDRKAARKGNGDA